MITKVRNLTHMNIIGLRAIGYDKTLGATVAEFDGSPADALKAVEEGMSKWAGTSTVYRSLSAVRRKLTAAAPRMASLTDDGGVTALTPYVSVSR